MFKNRMKSESEIKIIGVEIAPPLIKETLILNERIELILSKC